MTCNQNCPVPRISESHCAACHQTFGNLDLFDRHQEAGITARARWSRMRKPQKTPRPALCVSPESLGFVRDARGTWQTPEGLVNNAARATRMRAVGQRNKHRAA